MECCLRIVLLFCLVSGTLTQGFDLSDALDPVPTPAKPKEKPKVPSDGGSSLELEDALGPDPAPKPTVKPPKSGGGDDTFELEDALGPDLKPNPKPGDNPPKTSGGGGSVNPGYDQGGADQPQEAGGGQIAAIVSAVGAALIGAASSYFAYQKKKLCFKLQGGQDPESGKGYDGTQSNPQSDPQVFSNLLKTS